MGPSKRHPHARQKGDPLGATCGFTLVELVVLLMVLGLIAAVSAPRFFQLNTFEERGFFDETLSAVRYAHKLAITSGCHVRVQVGASGYTVTSRDSCTSGTFADIRNPATGGTSYDASPPSSVTVSGSVDFYYDKIGQPRTLAGALAPQSSVDIGTRRITVEPTTGFAHSG